MQDEAGIDEKVIAVPVSRLTHRYDQIGDYKDLPAITVKQIQHFFEHYKDLEEEKWVKVLGWGRRRRGQEDHPRERRARQG